MPAMRPVDKFNKIIGVVRLVTRLLGTDVANPNYKINWIACTVFLFIGLFHIFGILTIVKRFSEDWTIMLMVFGNLSAAAQGLAKILTAVSYPRRFYTIHSQLKGIYEKYQTIDERYAEKLGKRCDQMRKIIVGVGLVYVFGGVLIMTTPFIIFFYNGEWPLMLLIEIPVLNTKTDTGQSILLVFHVICVAMGCFGLYGGDLYVLIYLTHSLIFYDIFILKVEDLHTMLDESAEDNSVTETLTDIAEWHQLYLSFNDNCNSLFYWVISAQVTCSTVAMIATLFIILTGRWPGAYSYLIISTNALYIYCILGTRIEICNDSFCSEIYNLRWYALSAKQQKTVQMMLLKSQSPRNILIVDVLSLTVSTALKITRLIFSMFTMFVQLVE